MIRLETVQIVSYKCFTLAFIDYSVTLKILGLSTISYLNNLLRQVLKKSFKYNYHYHS